MTTEALEAKDLVEKICQYISKKAGRQFYIEMIPKDGIWEGHIIDSGKCIWHGDEVELSTEGEDIGMVFFGGFHDEKEYGDAESAAWISLLYDCIGLSEDYEIREYHNLTQALRYFGPKVDLNFSNVNNLKIFLKNIELDNY